MKIAILTLILLFVPTLLPASIDPIQPWPVQKLIVLQVNSSINPAVYSYLETELRLAADDPGNLVVLKLNTPGGLVSTTKDILTTIGNSAVPLIVWVTPEGASATSAGAIIASSAHGLVMNEGTNIGAATPVGMGEDIKDGRAKAINDLTALVKSLSVTRNRNPEAFAEMITKSSSFTSEEAVKLKIIDGIAHNLDELKNLYNQKTFSLKGQKYLFEFSSVLEVEEHPMDMGQSLLNLIAHPTTAYILFVLGAALLYFELQTPGGYIAGGIGALCLVLAAIAFQVLPLNFGAALLLVGGLVLTVLEIYITSYGLLAVSGLVCLGIGSLFLFRHDDSWMTISYPIIFSTLAGVAAFLGIMAWFLAKTKKSNNTFYSLKDTSGQIVSLLQEGPTSCVYQVKIKGETWKAKGPTGLKIGNEVRLSQTDNKELTLEITSVGG